MSNELKIILKQLHPLQNASLSNVFEVTLSPWSARDVFPGVPSMRACVCWRVGGRVRSLDGSGSHGEYDDPIFLDLSLQFHNGVCRNQIGREAALSRYYPSDKATLCHWYMGRERANLIHFALLWSVQQRLFKPRSDAEPLCRLIFGNFAQAFLLHNLIPGLNWIGLANRRSTTHSCSLHLPGESICAKRTHFWAKSKF